MTTSTNADPNKIVDRYRAVRACHGGCTEYYGRPTEVNHGLSAMSGGRPTVILTFEEVGRLITIAAAVNLDPAATDDANLSVWYKARVAAAHDSYTLEVRNPH